MNFTRKKDFLIDPVYQAQSSMKIYLVAIIVKSINENEFEVTRI
jgi:hypothetical protein